MKKQILCAVLVASLAVSGLLTGCMTKEVKKSEAEGSSSQAAVSSNDSSSDSSSESQNEQVKVPSEWKTSLSATKIGSVSNTNVDKIDAQENGIIYQDSSDKYGIMSLDGKKDTTAKYYYASKAKTDTVMDLTQGFFGVYSKDATETDVNVAGLVNGDCEEVIECKYGYISVLSDRFARVITAKSQTTDKDAALYYVTDKIFSITPDDGDTMYTGTWEIFDLQTKKLVPGVAGTKAYTVKAKGNFIEYTDDNGNDKTVDATGKEITDGRTIFNNGSYLIEKNGSATIYDTNDKTLFDYNSKDVTISEFKDYYYVARSGDYPDTKYSLYDETGKEVSTKFDKSIYYVYPDFVGTEDSVSSLDGTITFDCTSIRYDKYNQDTYCAYSDNKYVVFDKSGNVLYEDDKSDDSIEYNDFLIYQDGDDYKYYCYADKAFKITGYSTSDWLINQEDGKLKDLIDTRSGNTLLDKYDHYTAVEGIDGYFYIYAFNQVNGKTSNGDFDVYTIG